MKKLMIPLACIFVGVQTANATSAMDTEVAQDESRVAVEWLEPKSYRDVRSANSSSTKFRKQVFKELEEHLVDLSEDLPEGQSLKIRVTDLDLAGRVEPGGINGFGTSGDIRVVRQIDIPRITFEYDLLDAEGQILKTEEVNLKDMGFLDGPRITRRNEPYSYEKHMLSEWFKDNLVKSDA
ncbi:DUF3016 domain-containing protein [Glaciecola petra]|uniref:DUF3016 domain-containing protein n=1 Tax=Glaciecola petra TaxID=3075602 RepID=A0ABU2ZP77_9ALTE|nr:DUF3016 domain-containing protein [Aestuariibacter sp. P117]MDT0593389.1 DUF3016 domain-containing protein [Aestuariibacter sp. P117]